MKKEFYINSIKNTSEVLEYFNGFHDSFIKAITIRSLDEITPDKNQICTGLFDITLTIAHYNYNKGKPPFNQLVQLNFSDSRNINMNFHNIGSCDWNIDSIEIKKTKESLLCVLQRNIFNGKKWTKQQHNLFLFSDVKIIEQ